MMNGVTEAELLLNSMDISVLEHQRANLRYHHPGFDSTLAGFFSDSSIINGGDIDGFLGTDGLDLPAMEGAQRLSISPTSVMFGSDNLKKRKFDSVVTETKYRNEKMKKKIMNREEEDKSKITEQNHESTKSIMKMKNKTKNEHIICSIDSSKVTNELQKMDYIHVRARRGQATDSHSIAERVRREKISERMKFLQDLVPGCDKITGKAGMLDEIINYVQSLQRQIEFLSMKLAALTPSADFDTNDIFAKEVVSTPMTNLPNIVMPSHEMVNSGYLHFNPMQQLVTNTDPYSCFNNGQSTSMWSSDMQNLYSSLGL